MGAVLTWKDHQSKSSLELVRKCIPEPIKLFPAPPPHPSYRSSGPSRPHLHKSSLASLHPLYAQYGGSLDPMRKSLLNMSKI
jgi:hypothetical protein